MSYTVIPDSSFHEISSDRDSLAYKQLLREVGVFRMSGGIALQELLYYMIYY